MDPFDLYEKYGENDYIGEEVTQLQHAVQVAKMAEKYCNEKKIPYSTKQDVVLGAFFHNIGHLLQIIPHYNLPKMDGYGVLNHEIHGANYLRQFGYNKIVYEMVKNQINTKRYLVTKNPNYYHTLSDASKERYEFQGKPMTPDELINFESNNYFRLHLQMRNWDDKAKTADPEDLKDTNNYFIKLKSFK